MQEFTLDTGPPPIGWASVQVVIAGVIVLLVYLLYKAMTARRGIKRPPYAGIVVCLASIALLLWYLHGKYPSAKVGDTRVELEQPFPFPAVTLDVVQIADMQLRKCSWSRSFGCSGKEGWCLLLEAGDGRTFQLLSEQDAREMEQRLRRMKPKRDASK